MREQEAINVLVRFRKEFRALGQMKAMEAFNALMNTGRAVTTAQNLALDFSSALSTLKASLTRWTVKGSDFHLIRSLPSALPINFLTRKLTT
jgi:hypothetical protein